VLFTVGSLSSLFIKVVLMAKKLRRLGDVEKMVRRFGRGGSNVGFQF
jgi:hypothetical protein